MKGIIEKVVINPAAIPPIIVNFENGTEKKEKSKKLECSISYDSKKQKRVLALSNNKIVYRGYQPHSEESLTYTMFALHNKTTGKVRLVQVENWSVAPVLSPQDDVSDESDEVDHESYDTKTSILNKEFGSKKVKKRTELLEKMAIDEKSMADQLENSVAQIEIDENAFSIPIPDCQTDSNIMPPCNREANSPEDVYDLNDIIPQEQLVLLSQTVDEILNRDLTRESTYFTSTLEALKNNKNRKRKIAILEYINGTCKWLNKEIRLTKQEINELCPTSYEVSDYIVKAYSSISSTGRTRPASIEDKAVLHSLILAFMIGNFKVDIDEFGKHIMHKNKNNTSNTFGRKKLKSLCEIIGAVPDKKDKKCFILKTPIPAPKPLVKQKRKK